MDGTANGSLDGAFAEKLSERESALLRQAGDRVFSLSRRLADADREASRLAATNDALRELLEETRRSRDILSAQVSSLQAERDREYEERAELRRLLASLHMQLQELLPAMTSVLRAQSHQSQLAFEQPRLTAAPQRAPVTSRAQSATPPVGGQAAPGATQPPEPERPAASPPPAAPPPAYVAAIDRRRSRRPSFGDRLRSAAREMGITTPRLPGR